MPVYAMCGTCKDLSVGPVAILSLIVAGLCSQVDGHTDPADAVILSLLSGVFQVILGLGRLGRDGTLAAWLS